MLDRNTEILIVGLGLMGGSYARALTAAGYCVDAIDRDPEAIRYALAEGIIRAGATDADPALIGRADLVVFALYPHVFLMARGTSRAFEARRAPDRRDGG